MRSQYPHLVMARPWRRELCAPAPLLTPLTLQCHPCGSTPLLSGVWPFLGTQNSRFSKARNNFHALPTQLFSSINMADTPSSLGTLLSGCFWPPSLSSCYNRSPSSSTTRLSSACSISTGFSRFSTRLPFLLTLLSSKAISYTCNLDYWCPECSLHYSSAEVLILSARSVSSRHGWHSPRMF